MSDNKSLQRLIAVQAIYEVSINKNRIYYPVNEIFNDIIESSSFKNKLQKTNISFALEIYDGVYKNAEKIDRILSGSLNKLNKIDTMDRLLKAIFKPAIFELFFHNDLKKNIIISEYLLITKRFFADKECALMNGVLDNLHES